MRKDQHIFKATTDKKTNKIFLRHEIVTEISPDDLEQRIHIMRANIIQKERYIIQLQNECVDATKELAALEQLNITGKD